MTFYTEKFNGVDEGADNPPNPFDDLKNVPFAGTRNPEQIDAGITLNAPNDIPNKPDLRDSSEMADAGIPWEAPGSTLSYTPDLRDSSEQVDAGIPLNSQESQLPPYAGSLEESIKKDREELKGLQDNANAERRAIDAWQVNKERQQKLDEELYNHLESVETNYVENRTDLPGRKEPEQGNPVSQKFASEQILVSDNAKELESYLDVLQNNPYAIEDLFRRGIGMTNEARGSYPKSLSEEDTKQLKNFVSLFASLVERGIRIPQDFDTVRLIEKGDDDPMAFYSDSTKETPLGVVISEIADMVEEKGTGETSIDNPINELSGAKGDEKISPKKLADLAVKAKATRNKLSNDTINFPA